MKLQTIIDLVEDCIDSRNVNQARDLLDVLDTNKDSIKHNIYITLVKGLTTLIKETPSKPINRDLETAIYDFSKFENTKPSWYQLWNKKKYHNFASFFTDYLLPTFHKVPSQHIQHPVMACFALLNVAAIPPEGKKPNGICTGQSRTGKSKFAERVMKLLPRKHTVTIKGNSSPLAITEAVHKVCYISGDENSLLIRPSVTRFDNIYWEEFIGRLDIHYVTLLAVERDDAICEIAGKNGGKYHTFSKYVFTTVQQPVRDTAKMDELLNRGFVFYFDRGFNPDTEPSIYSWEGFDKEYLQLWNKEDVESKYFKILAETMTLKTDKISLEHLEISRVMIATGLYLNVFNSFDDAIESFANYWQYANSKQENIGSLLFKLLDNYLTDYYYSELEYKSKLYKAVNKPVDVRISFTHLSDYLQNSSHGIIRLNTKLTKEIEDIFVQHDLILKQSNSGLEFVKREFLG